MRKMWIWILTILLLAGCGAEAPAAEPEAVTPPETAVEDVKEYDLTLAAEWEVYDPSVAQVWFLLQNNGDETAETGAEYALEVLADGTWQPVPFREDVGWDMMLYLVHPGERLAMRMPLSLFDCDFSGGGTYRVVKDGATAEFRMEAGAAVSAEQPYGFGPLEDLPDTFGADSAGERDVVFTREGVRNGDAVGTFLEKVDLGLPCQLRTVQDFGEGAVMVIDAVYENSHFLWRMWDGRGVTEQRFSYLVTDGENVYLSNGTDWASGEQYGDRRAFLAPDGKASPELVAAVEAMTADRLAQNTARYRVWSADGVWSAALTRIPTEFSVEWRKPGEGSGGSLYDLRNWDGPETAITQLSWREDGTLRLVCETAGGKTSRLVFDPATERLTRP